MPHETGLDVNPYTPPGASLDRQAAAIPAVPRVALALDFRLLAVLAATLVVLFIARPGNLADPLRDAAWSNADQTGGAMAWIGLVQSPVILAPLLALWMDAVRLGAWRRFWLLLTAGAAIPLWLTLASVPGTLGALAATQFFLLLVMTAFSTAESGLAVDVGQRHGATGTVSGVRLVATAAGTLLLLALEPVLRERPLIWTAAAVVVVLAAYAAFAARALAAAPRLPQDVPRAGAAWRTMLASGPFWLTGFLLFLLAFASHGVLGYVLARRAGELPGAAGWPSSCGLILAGLAYLALCRRCDLRWSLFGAVGATVGVIGLTFAAVGAPAGWAVEGREILIGVASLPLLDLALRVTPRGLEALGFTILQAHTIFGAMLATSLGFLPGLSGLAPAGALAILLGVVLVGLFGVFLLPPELAAGRDRYVLHGRC